VDRLAEIWRVAKRVNWFSRGGIMAKQNLKPLRMELRPQENLIGVVPTRFDEDSAAIVVTDQHVYVSCWEKGSGWREFLAQTPAKFQCTPRYVCIPLSATAGPVHINRDNAVVLPIEGHGSQVLAADADRVSYRLIKNYISQARQQLPEK
jgi:hypothetical protein